ncbi:MAG: TlpA disulfide reductase family protein [Draconibacterium sp.]|nr:TlpA disulfide reductase family protein [Draconibacterium sp.]
MKKYFILLLGIALFACTQQKGFKIEVNLEGAEGQIVLEQRTSGEWVGVDTADVVDGVAVLEGEVTHPDVYYLSVLGQRAKTVVFVENTTITVSGKADSIYSAEVSGSITHNEYKAVNDHMAELSNAIRPASDEYRAARAAKDEAKMKELEPIFEKYYDDIEAVQVNFINDNPASYATPYFVTRNTYGKEAEELENIVNGLDPKLHEVQSIIELKDKIEKLKVVAIGQIAPDFTQNDPDGNPITFSDVYSKHELTLLDFWAAWCGPCRGENPNVVAVYNDYKDKGFTVFGVSLDREKEAWLKAIEDDKLTWTQVSNLDYWNNPAAKLYVVSGIPHSILIDKNGKILAKNKREDELREAVAEFFEK